MAVSYHIGIGSHCMQATGNLTLEPVALIDDVVC